MSKPMALKQILKETVYIIAAAAVAALIVNSLHPRGIPLIGDWDPSRGVVTADAGQGPVDRSREIDDVRTAKKRYDGGAVFVDARSLQDCREGRIRGAYCLPAYDNGERVAAFLEKTTPDTPVVTYCSGRTCEDSHRLAALLTELGYSDVGVFIDGYPAWVEAGYPVER